MSRADRERSVREQARRRALQAAVAALLVEASVQDVVRAVVAAAGEGGDDQVLLAAIGEQPLPGVLQLMATHFGEVTTIGSMLALVKKYALNGAEMRMAERTNPGTTDCERCQRRDAELRKIEQITRRTVTKRPIGGGGTADPNEDND